MGLYCPTSQADTAFTDWKYLSNTQAPPDAGVTGASVTFTVPNTVGTACQVRLFANDTFTKLATSGNVTITVPSAPSSSASSPRRR